MHLAIISCENLSIYILYQEQACFLSPCHVSAHEFCFYFFLYVLVSLLFPLFFLFLYFPNFPSLKLFKKIKIKNLIVTKKKCLIMEDRCNTTLANASYTQSFLTCTQHIFLISKNVFNSRNKIPELKIIYCGKINSEVVIEFWK